MSGIGNPADGERAASSDETLRQELARQLFSQYVQRLKGLVRWTLQDRIRRKIGTSAIVQEVFASFFQNDRHLWAADDLWPLLATITRGKVVDVAKQYRAKMRDYRREQPNLADDGQERTLSMWDVSTAARGPTQEDAAMLIEAIESLTEEEQALLNWRLEGNTYAEIARLVEHRWQRTCCEKTVHRRFDNIRRKLEWMLHD